MSIESGPEVGPEVANGGARAARSARAAVQLTLTPLFGHSLLQATRAARVR
ncbi:MAG: hypothetical protein KDB71_10835 [Mycobacterium sp.]|nr:hypothetical protein [Mycobacterium sp.]